MSAKRSVVSKLFEGLGRVTWGVLRRKLNQRRAHSRRNP